MRNKKIKIFPFKKIIKKTIIASSNVEIDNKKNEILKQTTNILYELNSIKIENINNLDQISETTKTIENISNAYTEIANEISRVEAIYNKSKNEINNIKDFLIN